MYGIRSVGAQRKEMPNHNALGEGREDFLSLCSSSDVCFSFNACGVVVGEFRSFPFLLCFLMLFVTIYASFGVPIRKGSRELTGLGSYVG